MIWGHLRIDPAIVRVMKSSGHWDSNNEVDASLMHDMGA
nr:MAG TPA: cullin family protein [Caudoviricetes sp.]